MAASSTSALHSSDGVCVEGNGTTFAGHFPRSVGAHPDGRLARVSIRPEAETGTVSGDRPEERLQSGRSSVAAAWTAASGGGTLLLHFQLSSPAAGWLVKGTGAERGKGLLRCIHCRDGVEAARAASIS